MADQKYKEYLPENEEQPNPLSKQAIKSLGKNPELDSLYWVQLIRLVLDRY